ncbi:DUF2690 domain-containing protein [Streptomyces sp. KM273126]|uniref:helix-turn-helix domain-containing protein n=1 Tax=Streptomyces sp. KM273126 TaxID=2545247 RepID=UPI001040BEDB|nr:XRE family transcriptional regulator [Streptomyces sp. KM273126]MBA2812548.1 DUF2690 domain-containing protein [Streptomyces sp. KM273126]
MARWRPLPAALDNDTRLLVERLRGLKDQAGLSLAELAARTAYSKSAWHRYLNGDKFPPRQAVEALGRLAGADGARLFVLWGVAHHAREDLPEEPAVPPTVPDNSPAEAMPRPRTPRRRRGLLVLVIAACVVLGVAAFAARLTSPSLSLSLFSSANTADNKPVSCSEESCQGRLPHASRCTQDARTVSSVTSGGYVVRLRYSRACSAVWSEVHVHGGTVVREVSIESGPDERLTSYPELREDRASSPMLAASPLRTEEACAIAEGKLACTSKDSSEVMSAPDA